MLNPTLHCAPRLASSPERRSFARPGCYGLLVVLLLGSPIACSRDARSVRLQAYSPSDEIFRISCGRDIQACRDEASEVCSGSYHVLESAGAPLEPERVSSAPGPRSTGPRYQRPKWVGQMVVACGDAPGQQTAHTPSAATPLPAAPLAAPSGHLCIPGVTQLCLGPAACRGAQACLPDGNGYGPCDCGSASKPSDEPNRADAGLPRASGS
jgi:hypothetical protein